MIFLGKSDLPMSSLNKLFEQPNIVIDKSILEKATTEKTENEVNKF